MQTRLDKSRVELFARTFGGPVMSSVDDEGHSIDPNRRANGLEDEERFVEAAHRKLQNPSSVSTVDAGVRLSQIDGLLDATRNFALDTLGINEEDLLGGGNNASHLLLFYEALLREAGRVYMVERLNDPVDGEKRRAETSSFFAVENGVNRAGWIVLNQATNSLGSRSLVGAGGFVVAAGTAAYLGHWDYALACAGGAAGTAFFGVMQKRNARGPKLDYRILDPLSLDEEIGKALKPLRDIDRRIAEAASGENGKFAAKLLEGQRGEVLSRVMPCLRNLAVYDRVQSEQALVTAVHQEVVFKDSDGVLCCDFGRAFDGLHVKDDSAAKRIFRDRAVHFTVIKNTLAGVKDGWS